MKKLLIHKYAITVIFITLLNLCFLAYGIKSYISSKPAAATSPKVNQVVEQKIKIKNVETTELASNEIGKKIGEGDYKFQSLDKSKITTGNNAELVIATNQQSGGHFVMAFVGTNSKPTEQQINPGWEFATLANDPMWAPGACSSKPTFLIQGKYIFIDDGKTNPNDKYNSYIVFDMQTSKYNYFGGANFTSDQGENEHIIKTVNENDKLVFYIDVPDGTPAKKNSNGSFLHVHGSDKSYVIRRVIDPQTLHYTDYSLPYQSPTNPSSYIINDSWNNIIQIDSSNSQVQETFWYTGSIKNGSIVLTRHSVDEVSNDNSAITDTPLELKLASTLKSQLPDLYNNQKIYDGSNYKSNLAVNVLGSYDNLKFITIAQRYDTFDTPAIYDTTTGKITTLTNQRIMSQPGKYVELGVF